MVDNPGVDITSGHSLVQYDMDERGQIAQQEQSSSLPLMPYFGPPPVVINKVYNINNPVGIQIESQGGLMVVDDPRNILNDDQPECQETGTQTDSRRENENEVKKEQILDPQRASKGIPKNHPITRLKPMPEQGTCRRVDRISQQIIARMEVLEGQGSWSKYDRFLKTVKERFKEDPDILVRVVLEDVVAAYFREDFEGGYASLQRAEDLVLKVHDPIQQQTHRLYLKSALLRKQKRHDEADNVNILALQGLPHMTAGRDTGATWYNIAALKAQVLCEGKNPPGVSMSLYQDAIAAFQNAIDHYNSGLDKEDETCTNNLRRAHIRLAMGTVGYWYDGTATCTNPDLISEDYLQKAENSLQEVENNLWEGIPNRMRCSWYLAKSDIFRRRGNVQRSKEMVEEALRVAQDGDFPTEVKFAEIRLGLLKTEAKPSSKISQMEEDAAEWAWMLADESSDDELTFLPKTQRQDPFGIQNGDWRLKPGEKALYSRIRSWIQSAVLLVMFFVLPLLTAVLIDNMYKASQR